MRKQLSALLLTLALLFSVFPAQAFATQQDIPGANPDAQTETEAPEMLPDTSPAPEAPQEQPEENTTAQLPQEEPSQDAPVQPTPEESAPDTPAPPPQEEPDTASELPEPAAEESSTESPAVHSDGIASGSFGDHLTWTLNAAEKTLTISGQGAMPDYTSEGDTPWFQAGYDEYKVVKTIILSPGITHVGSYSFCFMRNLREISLPTTLRSIGEQAFRGISLSSGNLVLPEGLQSIGPSAFSGSNLKQVTFPSTLREIGRSAFAYTSLTSLTLPKGITEIADFAFFVCNDMTAISLPEGITRIGANAFTGCQFTSCALPSTLTTIDFMAFAMVPLSSISLPNRLTTVGESAFEGCETLKSVTVPASVTSIGARAFGYANNADSPLSGFTITGSSGSAAETYAKENNIPFRTTNPATSLSTPQLLKAESVEGGARITWKAVSNAVSYEVYLSTDGGKSWKTPKIATGTSLIYPGLTSNCTYNFTVRAVNGSVRSGYQKPGLSLRYLGTPALSRAYNAVGGVQISWTKVTGAQKYQVYMSTDGGKRWNTPKVVTGTSYLYPGLSSSQTYTFTVRAVRDGKLSGYNSKGISCQYLATPQLMNAVTDGTEITVTWKSVPGANCYLVYSSTDGGKRWQTPSRVTGTSATFSGLTPGQTYHFTVRAGIQDRIVTSAYDTKGVSAKITPTTVLTSAVCVGNGVKVSWKPVVGAESYLVYYSLDEGKRWNTPKSTSGTSYVMTGLTSGTTYHFTVRAVINGVKQGYDKYGIRCRYLAAPTVTGAEVTPEGLKVTWAPVKGATQRYEVYYSTNGGKSWSHVYMAATGALDYTFTDLPKGQTYHFTVRANGESSARSGYQSPGYSFTYPA